MEQFKVAPSIFIFDDFAEFSNAKAIGKSDLVITNKIIIDNYLSDSEAILIDLYEFGQGEPTDKLVDSISEMIKDKHYDRVIGIGGGTILDTAKLFTLADFLPITPLFEGTTPLKKIKESILIPTTCGTGSEVTNISILELTSINTKKGLAQDELFADEVAIIPELISTLPDYVFAASSLDALVHAIESLLSPKATAFSELYSYKAIESIISGYAEIQEDISKRQHLLKEFLVASTNAGIAFSNAGCATVHAMSYPLGAKYHVAHGESNYSLLMGVLNYYGANSASGALLKLKDIVAQTLNCTSDESLERLGLLLEKILPLKNLASYNVKPEELEEFAASVEQNQQRLLANSFLPMNYDSILEIYKSVY